ncbi:hypothetical protein BJX99DRAFT_239779 [Aspergillus californicus]
MSDSSPLESLPVELQCSIIRYLDPIALISTSQTNTHFRTVINPQKTHRVEYLLAIECSEEKGGPLINFSRFGTLDPDRVTPEWEANRWACTGCVRLLPHYAFNNFALSTLKYRKPVPGSVAARQCTTWEPTSYPPKRNRQRQSIQEKEDAEEDRILRKRYSLATTAGWGERDRLIRFNAYREGRMPSFQEIPESQWPNISDDQENSLLATERKSLELRLAGTNRHNRRCIECRFSRGEFRGCAGKGKGIGTVAVPIVVGRQKSYGTTIDRYFPGVCDVLRTNRPLSNAPVFVIHREHALDREWTLYRVRCPGCLIWKELRAFRVGGMYPRWEPKETGSQDRNDRYQDWDMSMITEESLNGMRCNHCFLAEHGRGRLGDVLVKWLTALIKAQLVEATGSLRAGFNHLFWRLKLAPKDVKAASKVLIWDMRSLLDRHHMEVTRTDVALLRHRRTEWLKLYPHLRDGTKDDLWFYPDRWFMDWVHYWEESEGMWFWLKDLMDEIWEEGTGGVLVDWVLGRDEVSDS